ncbi:hypothetical protein GCM10023196_052570 [Actinoallomurus vinaceus]|uniref:Transcriptional regulator n=2 Tax=Actinoallomurus vinaceus TaxID=1080074 RepID=A0ABP8UGK6_9ACTN
MRSAGRLSMLDLICEVLRVDMSALIGEDPVRRAESCLEDAEVARIQSALERYPLTSPVGSPVDTAALRRRVEHAWAAFEFADYDVVSLVLPGIIEEAQHGHAAWDDDGSALLLIEVYQLASSTLRKLGEHSLAWLAGDRGMTLARQRGDAIVVAATGFRIANALLSIGRARQAQALNISLAETLQSELRDEADRALYGHVLLQAAIAAATAGDQVGVRDLVAEAEDAARVVSPGSNHHRLAFDSTNVLLHRVGALLALGEGGRAIEIAATIDADSMRMLRKERRAALLVDVARAYGQVGDRDRAVRALLEAETTASREVRCRPVAQATIADLLRRSRNAPPLELARLAERSGVRV